MRPPDVRALETAERVLVALRLLPTSERDYAVNALIESIEDDRAKLLAWMLGRRRSDTNPADASARLLR
jgi:hypothetical protein